MNFYKVKSVVIALLTCAGTLSAQELALDNIAEGFKKDKLFKLNGSASLSGIYYHGNNEQNERLPFTFFANGMLNLRIANLIDVPLSYTLTNVGGGFQYPTVPSRIAIHPSYKWAKAHLGNVAMTFSPYTLNGHLFDGAGIELEPKKWRVAAMMGRLQRAQDFDENNIASPAAYKRIGFGVKVGYVSNHFRASYNIFHAKDDINSINILAPDSFNIRPQTNIATSLEVGVKILKNLELSGEYANTGLTTITNGESSEGVTKGGAFNPVALLMKTTGSTEFHNAVKANLNYAVKQTVIGLGYERVDPGYRTLGSYYFNNDLENYTLNFNQVMFKNKMTFNTSVGFQRDNLADDKAATNMRTVGMVNIALVPNEAVNIIANYSNFRSHTNVQTRFLNINQVNPYQFIDTLDYIQVSQNAMLNTNFRILKTDKVVQNINLMGNFLDARDRNGSTENTQSSSRFYNAGATWSTLFPQKKITASVGYNYIFNQMSIGNTIIHGPTATMGYVFLKDKITTNVSFAYNITQSPGVSEKTSVVNSRFNARYAVAKNQQISLSVLGQNRKAPTKDYSDWLFTLGYDLSF